MWNFIARSIIRYRLALLIFLAVITSFMLYHARSVHMTYSNPQVIPVTNPKYAEYVAFKKQFGEDGNVMVIGIQTDQLFTTKVLNAWNELAKNTKFVAGVDEVIAIGNSVTFEKDTVNKKMHIASIFPYHINSQTDLDSLKEKFLNLPFYNNLLYNPETHATLMAVHINTARLNSKARIETVQKIQEYGKLFSEQTHLSIYYSGMPLIRTVMTTQIANETKLFLLLAAITTGLVLFILLRSMNAVLVSMLVVVTAEVWTLGTIDWFGYEITILTGLIPPLVVVISITNCVYLLNKYHIEFVKHGNKIKALTRIIEKIGLATLFTNLTAAIGFGVFYFTQSEILKQFGLVAGLNIAGIFLISIILIPCIYSFLPEPKEKHTDYLDRIFLNRVLRTLDHLVHYQRKWIFIATIVFVGIAIGGIFQLKTTGYIVDDIPHKDKLYTDLKFFEQNFHGVMPLEILVDTKKKGGVLSPARLSKINQLQDTLEEFNEFSKPLSIVEGIKFLRQAYYDGGPEDYHLPNELERAFIFSYLGNSKDTTHLLSAFVDSTRQVARISMSMADVGTTHMKQMIKKLTPKIYSVLDTSKYKVTITGSSVVFLEGSRYIIDGLAKSLLLAFLLIAICMGYLFRSWKMILFSLIPNLIPLIITAGIMGYFGIPLKPSTVLVFSIAFGIAIDNAIRFLAKYQQELHRHNWNIAKTVSMALYEAGISIIYTSIILFFGFIIFTLSNFGGTFYLGLLTSITLVVAMLNNLLLLPSLLLSLRKWMGRKHMKETTPADAIETFEEDEERVVAIIERH
ncbi:MAG TPA: MMPL family transporter [Chitinophagales bacterium]|nr:MMPL family transporter [Chitinophagales bacterium]